MSSIWALGRFTNETQTPCSGRARFSVMSVTPMTSRYSFQEVSMEGVATPTWLSFPIMARRRSTNGRRGEALDKLCGSGYFAMQSMTEAWVSELDKALEEISAIRRQMARAVDFRGYGPATFAVTGVLAALAALAQAMWLQSPSDNIGGHLALWGLAAATSAAIRGFEMVGRSRRIH